MNKIVDPAFSVGRVAATDRERSVDHLSTSHDNPKNEVSQWQGFGEVSQAGGSLIDVCNKDDYEGDGRCNQ